MPPAVTICPTITTSSRDIHWRQWRYSRLPAVTQECHPCLEAHPLHVRQWSWWGSTSSCCIFSFQPVLLGRGEAEKTWQVIRLARFTGAPGGIRRDGVVGVCNAHVLWSSLCLGGIAGPPAGEARWDSRGPAAAQVGWTDCASIAVPPVQHVQHSDVRTWEFIPVWKNCHGSSDTAAAVWLGTCG